MDRPRIVQRAERRVYCNDYVSVYDDEVEFGPTGRTGSYLRIVESDGAAGVLGVPVCRGRVGLVLTYRYPAQAWEWGFPRGFAHGSDPQDSIRAELVEELGAEPESLRVVGVMTPNSGLLSTRVVVFLAEYAQESRAPTDRGEVERIRWVTADELFQELRNGDIQDGMTLAAVALAVASGDLPLNSG